MDYNNSDNAATGIICQCRKCDKVFDWNEVRIVECYGVKRRVHNCGGSFTIIKIKNTNDEEYLDKLSSQYSW